jgi:type IV pilus assembly protein PilZ
MAERSLGDAREPGVSHAPLPLDAATSVLAASTRGEKRATPNNMSGRRAGENERPGGSAVPSSGLTNGASLDPLGAGHRGAEEGMDVPTAADAISGPASSGWNRRSAARVEVTWSVDCKTEDTFLYAAITNISEMGIFVRTTEPLAVGTNVTLRFAPSLAIEPFVLSGTVQWVNTVKPFHDNPNPGMGIRFSRLSPADRERIVEAIRTIAYLREEPCPRRQNGLGN